MSASFSAPPRSSERLAAQTRTNLLEKLDPASLDRARARARHFLRSRRLAKVVRSRRTVPSNVVCAANPVHCTHVNNSVYRPEFNPSEPRRPHFDAEPFLNRCSQCVLPANFVVHDETLAVSDPVVNHDGVISSAAEYDSKLEGALARGNSNAMHRTVYQHTVDYIAREFPEFTVKSFDLQLTDFDVLCEANGVDGKTVPRELELNNPIACILAWLSSRDSSIDLRTTSGRFEYCALGERGTASGSQRQVVQRPPPEDSPTWRSLGAQHLLSGLSDTQRKLLVVKATPDQRSRIKSTFALLNNHISCFADALLHTTQVKACALKYGTCAAPLGLSLHIDGVAVTSYGRSETPIYLSHMQQPGSRHNMLLLGFFNRCNLRWPAGISAAKRTSIKQAYWRAQLACIISALQSVLGVPFHFSTLSCDSDPVCPTSIVPYLGFVASDMLERWKLAAVKHGWCVRCTSKLKEPEHTGVQRSSLCHCCCTQEKSAAALGFAERPQPVLQEYGYPYEIYACDILHEFNLGIVQKFVLYMLAVAKSVRAASLDHIEQTWNSAVHTIPSFRRNSGSLMRAGEGTLLRAYEFGLLAPALPTLMHCAMAPLLGARAAQISTVAAMIAHVHAQLRNIVVFDETETLQLHENMAALCDTFSDCFRGVTLTTKPSPQTTPAAKPTRGQKFTGPVAPTGVRRSGRLASQSSSVVSGQPDIVASSVESDSTSPLDDLNNDLVMFPKLHSLREHFVPDILLLGPPGVTSTATLERAHSIMALPEWEASSKRGTVAAEMTRRSSISQWYRLLVGKRRFILQRTPSATLTELVRHAIRSSLYHIKFAVHWGYTPSTGRISLPTREEKRLVTPTQVVQSALDVGIAALLCVYLHDDEKSAALRVLRTTVIHMAGLWVRRNTAILAEDVEERVREVKVSLQTELTILATPTSTTHGPWTAAAANTLGFSEQTSWISAASSVALRQHFYKCVHSAFVSRLGRDCWWRRCAWVRSGQQCVATAAAVYAGTGDEPRDKIDSIAWTFKDSELRVYLLLAVYFGKRATPKQQVSVLCHSESLSPSANRAPIH